MITSPLSRCADLISGVTKVLQSVGVNYCTVQPEFASCSGFSSRSLGDASPVIHRDDPSPPLLLPCSLACGRACAGSMCCSLLEEEAQSVPSPTTAETKEEPQILVIENTFLWQFLSNKYACPDVKEWSKMDLSHETPLTCVLIVLLRYHTLLQRFLFSILWQVRGTSIN